jgi:hypothetical protein
MARIIAGRQSGETGMETDQFFALLKKSCQHNGFYHFTDTRSAFNNVPASPTSNLTQSDRSTAKQDSALRSCLCSDGVF